MIGFGQSRGRTALATALFCRPVRAGMLVTLALASQAYANPAATDAKEALLSQIKHVESRMDRIGNRLAVGNARLCKKLQPDVGVVLHALDSYHADMRSAARSHFGFGGNLAIMAVRSAAAAERAGLRENDSIVAVNGVATEVILSEQPSLTSLIAADRLIASFSPMEPIVFTVNRQDQIRTIAVQPEPKCRVRFELIVSPRFDVSADGEMVQISSRFFATLSDSELAALLAHELAHNILEHPQRLAARGVSRGMLAGLGRNVPYYRQTETQADILSVALLVNAGYPAHNATRFWAGAGRVIFGGAFKSRSHPSWKDRAATTAKEAERLAREVKRPIIPEILSSRENALDGNWQAILVRAN